MTETTGEKLDAVKARLGHRTSQKAYPLACMEVWGGNRKVEREVELPGLAGWVYSKPLEASTGGGDVHYFSVCSGGLISRVAVADVSGHGPGVSPVAETLRTLMRRHIDTWDQSDFMRDLDRSFREDREGSEYATAAMLGFFRKENQLVFTNAGHPLPLRYRAGENSWELLMEDEAVAPLSDLPLGLIRGTTYRQTVVDLSFDDTVVLYTDAIVEIENVRGEQLRSAGLLELAKELPTDAPATLGRALVEDVHHFGAGQARRDDETVVVIQRLRD